ncbi:hypothetical protein DE146DRAFT_783938 [Phaeosphaeria sp. MPI-PUGE-AT-0046c]|nr:hypothetical protein DE146DRAFT_783938 [Phaeosphaeria sp. MPI-PUGE-AT-0046c]
MKTFTIASALALATVGSAQLNNIPQCALSCFIGPLSSDGCSALTDFKCHCQKGAQLLTSVQPCVQGACSAADLASAVAAVQKTCQENGVPIVIPNASSAVASATSAAASAVSSKAAAATSAASSAAAAVSSAAASMASKVSSGAAAATSAMSMKPTQSMATFTGGAPVATQAAGLLGAAALAMLAL